MSQGLGDRDLQEVETWAFRAEREQRTRLQRD